MPISDLIYLPDLPETTILEEHFELTDQKSIYEDVIQLRFTEMYDCDVELLLNVEDAQDFYAGYYIPTVVDVKGEDPDKLTLEDVNLLNEMNKVQNKMMELADKLETLQNVSKSLGVQEKYEDALETLDAYISSKIMEGIHKYKDS